MNHNLKCMLLTIILACFLVTNAAFAQSSDWQQYIESGAAACKQGRYADAERSFNAALRETEKFGPQDARLATSLNSLAELYRAQGKYAEAEPLYKRSLAIREKALDPNHPNVATSLKNYAALLRKTNRTVEAEKLEARAKAILAKSR